MIPKIIHYCWLSKEPYPDGIKECIYSWKKYLPEYEFKLWNFSTFDIEQSQWVRDAFYSGKYAFAADYIRIYALYHYGGIYLDCDVEVLKSFNPLLQLPYFIGREQTEYGIEAATMGFEKGNPLLKDMLSYYENRRFFNGGKKFDIRPLPSIMKEHIEKRYSNIKEINEINEFEFSPNSFSIFKDVFFSPKKWDTKEIIESPKTYSIHHFAGSWLKKRCLKDKIKFRIYQLLGIFYKRYKI